MTLLSTSYTSLEDAWGSNFDHDHKKKKPKRYPKSRQTRYVNCTVKDIRK